MKLIADDVAERASRALEIGETGDYEVIRYLAERELVSEWYREGEQRHIPNEAMRAAIESNFEIRPASTMPAKETVCAHR